MDAGCSKCASQFLAICSGSHGRNAERFGLELDSIVLEKSERLALLEVAAVEVFPLAVRQQWGVSQLRSEEGYEQLLIAGLPCAMVDGALLRYPRQDLLGWSVQILARLWRKEVDDGVAKN